MERIEEFSVNGEPFVYIDFSGFKTIQDYVNLIEAVKPVIAKYPENSLNTISNIENIRLDTDVKNIFTRYLEHNKPYIQFGIIIGVDGIKKTMANTVIRLSGRKNIYFAFTKEQAIEWVFSQI